jgi:hypothetical protein
MTYGYYAVAFVDLLGQHNELQRLVSIPHEESSLPEILDVLRRTARRVLRVRQTFAEYLKNVSANRHAMLGLSAQQLHEYNKVRTLKFHQVGFSDSFVISVPLVEREPYGPTPPRSTCGQCCTASLE